MYDLTGRPEHFVSPIAIVFADASLGDDLDDYVYVVRAEPGMQRWQIRIEATKAPAENANPLPWAEAAATALQYELANRVRGNKSGLVTWPAWFLWGILGNADEQTARRMSDLWEARYRRKTYRKLDEIWKVSVAATGEQKERISVLSTQLIKRLRQLPDGAAKLARLANEVNRGGFSPDVFYRVYASDFETPASGEKWWTGELAYLNSHAELASLDLAETCEKMEDILDEGLPEPGVNGLREEDMDEVNQTVRELMRLTVAGHPMARPAAETALNALEFVKKNDMKKARPSWSNARSILGALEPWKRQINAVLDRLEYSQDQKQPRGWLAQKGISD